MSTTTAAPDVPAARLLRPPLPLRAELHAAAPTYLRVIVTTACPMQCAYCHGEGDLSTARDDLSTDDLTAVLQLAIGRGVRKLKLLGGEPLLRSDLPEVVRRVRASAPDVDLSVITSGAVPAERLDALFAAGLSRCNLSIHGFGAEAFARRSGNPKLRATRDRFLARLLEHGRPVKLNYVYGGREDEADLLALLTWAAGRPVVVNVLDDLNRPELSHRSLIYVLHRLCGAPTTTHEEPDPDSLPTLRLRWANGLEVEVKHQQLGLVAPWRACGACPQRASCREGIHAFRLDHRGELRPCLRPGQTLDLRASLLRGAAAADADWDRFEAEVLA